jgi:hypothetical protein
MSSAIGSSWGRHPFQTAQVRTVCQVLGPRPMRALQGSHVLDEGGHGVGDRGDPPGRPMIRCERRDGGAPATLARLQRAEGAVLQEPGPDAVAAPRGEGPDRGEVEEGGNYSPCIPARVSPSRAQVVDHRTPEGQRTIGGRRHSQGPSRRPPGRARALAVEEAARAEEKGQRRDDAEGAGRAELTPPARRGGGGRRRGSGRGREPATQAGRRRGMGPVVTRRGTSAAAGSAELRCKRRGRKRSPPRAAGGCRRGP